MIRSTSDDGKRELYRYEKSAKEYLAQLESAGKEEVAGVMARKEFVSAIDPAHPWWPKICDMICSAVIGHPNVYTAGAITLTWLYELLERKINGHDNLPANAAISILAVL